MEALWTRSICRRSVLTITAVIVFTAMVPTITNAQTPLADSILNTEVFGLQLVSSEQVDFSEFAPGDVPIDEFPEAWLKIFASASDGITILAIQFEEPAGVRAGLAGAMSNAPLDTRRLHASSTGVVIADAELNGEMVRYAFYGEGNTGYVLTGFGPGRERLTEMVLAAQLEHSVGDRYPLRTDENERYLEEQSRFDLAYKIGSYGAPVLLGAAILFLLIRRFLRKSKGAHGTILDEDSSTETFPEEA